MHIAPVVIFQLTIVTHYVYMYDDLLWWEEHDLGFNGFYWDGRTENLHIDVKILLWNSRKQ